MLTEPQIRMLRDQLEAARSATSHAHDLWRRVARSVAEVYDTGQATRPRTTATAIARAIGLSPQQVSKWRQKANGQ